MRWHLVHSTTMSKIEHRLDSQAFSRTKHRLDFELAKFHPSAGCHILPLSYTVAVFTYAFSSSGSKPSGLTISSRGIHQSSWMRTSSPTFAGFTDEMWWQAFRYIFRNPACSLRMHPSRDGTPVGKTIRYPDYGQLQNHVISTGSHTTCTTSLGLQWWSQSVRVYCENSTAVAYIRKQGEHILSPCFTRPWNCSISWISMW